MATILEMKNICKSFFTNKVLDNVHFDLRRGEIHTLIGENGAGKSTLMKILAGVYSKDAGIIELNGKAVEITNPHRARQLGISMIFQELNVLDNLSIHENIFLGREETSRGFLKDAHQIEQTRATLSMLGIDLNPKTPVEKLKISDKQMVEIAKSLSFSGKIIIMDEPTSSLSEKETDTLFSIIRKLKSDLGISFIFISHRLNEIRRISDRITILRDGRNISTIDCNKTKFDEKAIVRQMVGREINNFYVHRETKPSDKDEEITVEPIMQIEAFSAGERFSEITFPVYKGEVLGIAGLLGSGRTEVLQAIMGLLKRDAGEIYVEGQREVIKTPQDAMRLGIGYVPEDRRNFGLVLEMSVSENVSLPILRNLARYQFINRKREKAIALESVDKFTVKSESIEAKVKFLSGGNQQKVVIAKSLVTNPKIILLDEPTRGIDVKAKHEIYSIISKLTAENIAVVMVSSDLPEIFGISDKIMVMYEGQIAGMFKNTENNHQKIMNALVGVENEDTGKI